MTYLGFSFDEIAARLQTAAQCEMLSINQLELMVAKTDSVSLHKLTVAEVRRQAAVLGAAHKIALALARQPDLARLLFDETGAGSLTMNAEGGTA